MQGLLAAALAPTAPPRSQPSSARPAPAPAPLSSANLALHTSANPPAPRRTVQQFLAAVTRVHAANAYDLGPPSAGELNHVKTPPRAIEARRKRKLQDLEDRGESWITRDKTTPRAATTGTEQALVLIRPDADLLIRGSTTSETADLKQHERKKSLVASMMRRKSTPPANTASATQRNPLLPISGLSPASNESSILMPRTETKPATTRPTTQKGRKKAAEECGGKENRPGREEKSSWRKGKNANRRDTDKDAEQEELEEHEARLEARRDRRRQNALIRKDRSLAATAVGATAAAKLKKSKSRQRPVTTVSDSNASSDEEEEKNALETTGYRTRKGKGTKDVRSRKKVAGLDRPQHVGQGRLTLKPVALGIFGKGKASARAKTGNHQLAFDEEAFLSGAGRNGNGATRSSTSSSSASSSEEEDAREAPTRRHASRNAGNSAPKTYGSRPSKRRSGSAIRQRVPDADDEVPDSQEGTPNQDAAAGHPSAAALDRTAAKRPAAAAKKRLSGTKKQTPAFELDIPPWPRTSSLARRSRPVDDDKGASVAAAADADDADSTHPSILSAASLARRKAERPAAEKRMSIDADQEAAPEAISFDGSASVHVPARKADEPIADDADDADLWQGPEDNVDSANTSGDAFERLLAQVTNAADDSFEASPPSFEAFSARSAMAGESGLQDQPRGVPASEPADEVEGAVLVGEGADAYLVGAATFEEPTTEPAADNTLISFSNETVFDEAEPVAFDDLDGAQSASAAVVFRSLIPIYGADVPERFPTPSDFSRSFVVADHDDDVCLDDGAGAPMELLDDEAAFRTAMRQQWPKTLL